MSLLTNVPIQNVIKRRRIPNAFMLFVKDNKANAMQKHPGENWTVIGTFLGKLWKSLNSEEKQVYYDQYKALKEKYNDASVNVMDDDLIREVDEITKEMPKLTKLDDDSDACIANGPFDSKKHKTRVPKSVEDSSVLSTDSKGAKKIRRGKNPFLIFAKEQRNKVKPTSKNHKSTILGNMWQDLDYAEKKKYKERARMESMEMALLDADTTPGPSVSGSQKKNRNYKKGIRKVLPRHSKERTERTLSKKNEARSSIESTVDAVASGSSSVIPEVSSISNPSDSTPFHHASQSYSSASGTYLPTSNTCFAPPSSSQYPTNSGALSESMSAFDQQSSTPHSREPFYRTHGLPANTFAQPLCLNSASESLTPNQPYFGGPYRPYFSGMPSFYPPDPLSYFWIYQQSMPPYHPFSTFYQSHCPCSSSYGAYPGSHFRSFIYGQSGSTYPSASPTYFNQPAQVSSPMHRDDVAPNLTQLSCNERGASDNDNNLVVVDDEQERNEQRPINKESPHQ